MLPLTKTKSAAILFYIGLDLKLDETRLTFISFQMLIVYIFILCPEL